MSVLLILSSFVTTLLIPEEAYQIGGKASGRAIAYLAHQYFGGIFGTVYDVATILILSLAGASAMAGLLHLIPRYLPRFGMAPLWVSLSRPLVLVLLAINILVTLIFKADVEAQSGAYATGVLVLITSAAFAATLALWREKRRAFAAYSAFLLGVHLHPARQLHRAPRRPHYRRILHPLRSQRQRAQPLPAQHRNAHHGSSTG